MTYEHALPSIMHLPFRPVRGFESETKELARRRRDAEGEKDMRAAKAAHDAIRSLEFFVPTAQADGD